MKKLFNKYEKTIRKKPRTENKREHNFPTRNKLTGKNFSLRSALLVLHKSKYAQKTPTTEVHSFLELSVARTNRQDEHYLRRVREFLFLLLKVS